MSAPRSRRSIAFYPSKGPELFVSVPASITEPPLRHLHVPAPARDRLNREPHARDSKVGGKPTAAVGTCALVLTIPQFLRFPKFVSSPVPQVVLLPAHAYVQAPAGTIAEGPAGHGLITCLHLDEARLIHSSWTWKSHSYFDCTDSL